MATITVCEAVRCFSFRLDPPRFSELYYRDRREEEERQRNRPRTPRWATASETQDEQEGDLQAKIDSMMAEEQSDSDTESIYHLELQYGQRYDIATQLARTPVRVRRPVRQRKPGSNAEFDQKLDSIEEEVDDDDSKTIKDE